MVRQQWKICATGPADGDPHWTTQVYVRDVGPDGAVGEWHHVVTKSAYCDSLLPTRGHALKSLVRCLA